MHVHLCVRVCARAGNAHLLYKQSIHPVECPYSLFIIHPAQPFIRGPPVDLTVNQSSRATFSCTAQGNPVPTISWTGPSASFTTEDTLGTNFTVLSVLTIDSAVRALHEGAYTCSASNGVGPSPISSAALTVQGTAGDTSTTQHQMHCRPATPSQLHCTALQVSAHQQSTVMLS